MTIKSRRSWEQAQESWEQRGRDVAAGFQGVSVAAKAATAALRHILPSLPSGPHFERVDEDTRLRWLGQPRPTKPVAGPGADYREYLTGVFLPAVYHLGALPPSLGNKAWAAVQLADSVRVVEAYRRVMFVRALPGVPAHVSERALKWMIANAWDGTRIKLRSDEEGARLFLDGVPFAEHPEFEVNG